MGSLHTIHTDIMGRGKNHFIERPTSLLAIRRCNIPHPILIVPSHSHIALMLFRQSSMARPSIIETITNDEVFGENGGGLLQIIHCPVFEPARHGVDVDPLLGELASVAAYREAEAAGELEGAEILRVDFEVVRCEFVWVSLCDGLFWDAEFDFNALDGDVGVAFYPLGRHVDGLEEWRFSLSICFFAGVHREPWGEEKCPVVVKFVLK